MVNRQIGVGDSKYVIDFDPGVKINYIFGIPDPDLPIHHLLTAHVIRRMRSGRVLIFNANQLEPL